MFAPFRVRSFRFQWPADLLTSLSFEMEILIIGWYVRVETDSALYLGLVGALQYVGTLVAPLFGVVGDRIGRRTTLCFMRATYVVLAATMMTMGLSGSLTPSFVFAIVFLFSMVRQSDLVMRNALIGDTMPARRLMSAMSLSRTTQDTARIAGALVGAELFSALGIGETYIVVASFYVVSLALTFGVARQTAAIRDSVQAPPWRALIEGFAYAWRTPNVRAIILLAFLVNLTAYPATNGLLPEAVKQIFGGDVSTLGYLVGSFATGAFIGSLLMIWTGGPRKPARFMTVNISLWYVLLLVFAQINDRDLAMAILVIVGIVQGTAMISMSVNLLSIVSPRYRGRIMGVRMFAVYGLALGLAMAGIVIEVIGYAGLVTVYAAIGLTGILLLTLRFRDFLWE